MLEIIFLSDGEISDTDIPSRLSRQISYEEDVNIQFFSLSICSILQIYKIFFVNAFKKKN